MLTTTELSQLSGYSTATIRALARDGLIPAIPDNGKWVFPSDAPETLASMAADAEDGADELQEELEEMCESDLEDDDHEDLDDE